MQGQKRRKSRIFPRCCPLPIRIAEPIDAIASTQSWLQLVVATLGSSTNQRKPWPQRRGFFFAAFERGPRDMNPRPCSREVIMIRALEICGGNRWHALGLRVPQAKPVSAPRLRHTVQRKNRHG